MKKVIIAALIVAMCTSVSQARVVAVTSSTKDQQVNGAGGLVAIGQTTARVGYDTVAVKGDAFILVFPLPTLAQGESISNVSLSVYSTASVGNNKISWNIDVYGVRAANATTVLTNDFYDGANDANATKVIEDFIQIITTNKTALGLYTSSPSTTFGTWLASLYTGNVPNYSNVFIRMNADIPYANMTNSGGFQITSCFPTFATGDATDVNTRPVLNITTISDIKNIETSTSSLSITEGSTNSFQLRLNNQPASDVTVNVSRVSGDTNLQVLPDPTSLIFSTANWGTWQPVYVEALTDLDTNNATAQLDCVDVGGVYTSLTVQATQFDITPVALFAAVPTAGYAPLPVTFTDTSSGGITNRFWDFGDGETTNTLATSVSHTYTVAGTTSTVQLTVSGPLGGSTASRTVNVPVGTMRTLPLYDSFSDEVSASAIPAGWACFAPGSNAAHSSISSGSLSFAGLQASAGNSWGLGQSLDDYSQDFTSPNLGTNETVYFSFLMRLNSPLDLFSTGLFRLYDRADQNGSGVVVGWGTAETTNFATMGFSINNRNAGWSTATTKTPQTYTSPDTTYLVVASYTRGTTGTNGLTQLWINPDSATFGTATPPAATLSTNTYQSDPNWNRLEFISNGSGAGVPNWQVDEVRIATSWADVVPVYVAAAPVITSALNVTGTTSQAFSYQITADNIPSSFDAVGLPAGLSINTNSGAITGTPVAAGSNDVTISASNMIGTDSQTLVLIIKQAAPVITSVLSATGTVDQAFSYQITADNTPDSFDAVGLPAGLSINTNSGAITGTPVAAGSNDVTISASNMIGTDSQTLVLIIKQAAPVITSVLSAAGTVDQAFSYQITADNSPASFDAAGLPAGLSINTNSGAITGTPSAAGSNDVTISASNAGGTDSKTLVVVISPAEAGTDNDSDGLPNDWETLYFGGATNANPAAICANGINTVLEAYIAGLNPTSAVSVFRAAGTPPSVLSWNSASGRVYSVYWTTNLMNGLQCIASNLPWTQNSFTNPAPAASSFYKIDVRLE